MVQNPGVDVVMKALEAVERRDGRTLLSLYHPDIEFHWPPPLPYGGSVRGREAQFQLPAERTWNFTWDPLQPTQAQRRMDPRVVASNGREVVVLYHQRGLDPDGRRFEDAVLALYEVREGQLARAQMFHFDVVATVDFIASADVARRHR